MPSISADREEGRPLKGHTHTIGESKAGVVTSLLLYEPYFNTSGFLPFDLYRDKWARLQRQIVAIDALHFKHGSEQFNMINVTRELNKVSCVYCYFVINHFFHII